MVRQPFFRRPFFFVRRRGLGAAGGVADPFRLLPSGMIRAIGKLPGGPMRRTIVVDPLVVEM
jgi:hypothetical protein